MTALLGPHYIICCSFLSVLLKGNEAICEECKANPIKIFIFFTVHATFLECSFGIADQTATDSVPSIVDFYYTVQLYGDLLLFVNRAEEAPWKRLIPYLMKYGLPLGRGGRSSDLSAFCLVCKVLVCNTVLKW
jgi:hypothetical protein